MGTCSSDFKPRFDRPGESLNVIPMALELGYSIRDINKMYTFFHFCDIDKSGMVSIRGESLPTTTQTSMSQSHVVRLQCTYHKHQFF